jgi:hypothetical protein
VDGPDTGPVSAQDAGVVGVVVRHCLAVPGLQARAVDDLEGASCSATRHWRNKLVNLS